MADFDIDELNSRYEGFREPVIVVYIEGKKLEKKKTNLTVRSAEIELTSGYEAAIAEVTLAGVFDRDMLVFKTDKAKNFFLLGSTITILLGYGVSAREVFRGFIARVHFVAGDAMPGIVITAMDIKGSLMADRHSKRLKARYYSDAVKEILEENPLVTAKDDSGGDFIKLNIDNTPDKPEGGSEGGKQETDDRRVEMVEESGYEFIVKAAKKYNYEFFSIGQSLYFTQAKKNENDLIELSLGAGLTSLDIGYDITGLVRQVEVRNVDSDQGSYLEKSMKLNNAISMGNKAKPLVEKQTYVYIDPTAQSKEEVEYRANYLSNLMGYRLGSLNATAVGLPELIPGRFISIVNMGKPIENRFYLTRVRHVITLSDYYTEIEGCADQIQK